MKQYLEKIIRINRLRDPDAVSDQIEQTAQSLHAQGWYFVNVIADEMMETVTLCFERDLEV